MAARIGGILSNLVNQLAQIHFWIPMVLFGGNAAVAAVLATTLPETDGRNLPDTTEESETGDSAGGCCNRT